MATYNFCFLSSTENHISEFKYCLFQTSVLKDNFSKNKQRFFNQRQSFLTKIKIFINSGTAPVVFRHEEAEPGRPVRGSFQEEQRFRHRHIRGSSFEEVPRRSRAQIRQVGICFDFY